MVTNFYRHPKVCSSGAIKMVKTIRDRPIVSYKREGIGKEEKKEFFFLPFFLLKKNPPSLAISGKPRSFLP